MNKGLRADCDYIVAKAVKGVLPGAAVMRALKGRTFGPGRLVMVAIGKAAYTMALSAREVLGDRITSGIVITKYGHAAHDPAGEARSGFAVREAGHPLPDENTLRATQEALDLTRDLDAQDTVLFLVSGGGSALFELPFISLAELQDVIQQLLECGANIVEMNTIRKRLSRVKCGRFALHCAPARVLAVVLSDIIGDPLDMIASGPAFPDASTCADAHAVVQKYGLKLSPQIRDLLDVETPKELSGVESLVTGSVRELCAHAAAAAAERGYTPMVLTDSLDIQAREAGGFLAALARYHQGADRPLAFIAGGETVVKLTGKGLGGRNQELALAAAEGIRGLDNVAVFSVGSDGTDGPTDAAGGYADGETAAALESAGLTVNAVLARNDAYHALKAIDGLIVTGPTGTNVNDVAVVLVRNVSGESQ